MSAVAPLAGAWIETSPAPSKRYLIASLPSRERGLKRDLYEAETEHSRRSPRGSVD